MDTNTKERIAAAAIATLMGRPIEIMKTKTIELSDIQVVHYVREDGTPFEYHTALVTDRVMWRMKVDGVLGRHRDDPRDEVLKFDIHCGTVTITASQNGIPFNLRSYSL